MTVISDWRTSPRANLPISAIRRDPLRQLDRSRPSPPRPCPAGVPEARRSCSRQDALCDQLARYAAQRAPCPTVNSRAGGRHVDRGPRKVADPAADRERSQPSTITVRCAGRERNSSARSLARRRRPVRIGGFPRAMLRSSSSAANSARRARANADRRRLAPGLLCVDWLWTKRRTCGRPACRWFRRTRRSWTGRPGSSSRAPGLARSPGRTADPG